MNQVREYTRKQKEAYERHLVRYAYDSPEASHWLGRDKLWLRFEIMAQIDDLRNKSVLDFGCGNSLLLDFLQEKGISCEYCGWDISEKMIEVSKSRHPTNCFVVCDIFSEETCGYKECFDYIIVNGVFNLLFGSNEGMHWQWVKEILRRLWTLCERGIAVSFLTEHVDWAEKALYYCSVDAIASFCAKELSRWFVIRHDYQLYEFTIYIYKEPRASI